MPGGHESTYTPEVGEKIVERIRDGESLSVICRSPGMPTRKCVYDWIDRHTEFGDSYGKARVLQAHRYFDDVIDIADEPMADAVELQAAKLRVDSRKWVLARMNRAVYGDHASLNVGGQQGNPIRTDANVSFDALTEEQKDQAADLARRALQGVQ